MSIGSKSTVFLLRHPGIISRAGDLLMKMHLIYVNYKVNPIPRYGYGKPAHPQLYRIIAANDALYRQMLERLLEYREYYLRIPSRESEREPDLPAWTNYGIGAFDALQIYGFLCLFNPEKYFEIGSGASTKFARRAIVDHGLKTKIYSFGPNPRYEINEICDYSDRSPLEESDLSIFEDLEEGDVLFVDDGHQVFQNSGATVFFLEILPRLKKGVVVGIHDIFLPYDYPPEWSRLYYSEQYLLAAYLLSDEEKFEILLPCRYVKENPELNSIVSRIMEGECFKGQEKSGISFWFRIRR